MAGFTRSTTLPMPYAEAVTAVRAALADQGFGVLTEIDLAATLHEKLGVDIPSQVILGACRPPLAYAALQAEPSIGALLPCNVVVRSVGAASTLVEVVDPAAMMAAAQSDQPNPALDAVADEAGQRLDAALDQLDRQVRSPMLDTTAGRP
jgi:uncharacterized protein (DUF302 family)